MRAGAFASFTALRALLARAPALAQVHQGGYDLGPDYDAMLQQQLRQSADLGARMQQTEQSLVQRVMQDPECQAMYRRHDAAGGTLSFPQFAYRFVATAGFTPNGVARFRSAEDANRQREQAAWQDYRSAQQQCAGAQQQYMDGYDRDRQEAGRMLQGESSWVDPATGTRRALSYLGPDDAVGPATGQRFHRDDAGRYDAQDADGAWYPMQPAR